MNAQSKLQFGCLKFLSVNFNDTRLENYKAKKFSVCKAKLSLQINDIWDTGPDMENTDHSPDMGFYGPLFNQSEPRILKSHIIM
jgi:hypothetical protein